MDESEFSAMGVDDNTSHLAVNKYSLVEERYRTACECARSGDYEGAARMFEQIGLSSLDDFLIRYMARKYFLCAGICILAAKGEDGVVTAAATAKTALVRYAAAADRLFVNTREYTLYEGLCDACESRDQQKFVSMLREYEKDKEALERWQVSVLLKIKKNLSQKNGETPNGTSNGTN